MAFCPNCGTDRGARAACPECGHTVAAAVPPVSNWQAPPPVTQHVYVQNTGTNSMAVASLVCGFLCSLLAVIFGHIALSQISRSGEGGRGLAIAGLVLGYIGVGITALLVLAGAAAGL